MSCDQCPPAAASDGPPYAIPVAPLTNYYAAGPPDGGGDSGSGSGSDDGDAPQIRILMNGQDVTNTTQTLPVGSRTWLKVVTEPRGYGSAVKRWSVPEGVLKDFRMTQQQSTEVPLKDEDKQERWLKFKWMDATGGDVSVSAVVFDENNLPVDRTAKVTFKIVRPQVKLWATTTGLGVILEDGLSFGSVENTPAPLGVQKAGIDVKALLTPPEGFPGGKMAFVQTIHLEEDTVDINTVFEAPFFSPITHTSTGGHVLDFEPDSTDVFYDDPKSILGGAPWRHAFMDSPRTPAGSRRVFISRSDRFDVYLMYQPPGEGSVWTTVALLHWDWSGTATADVSGWGFWPLISRTWRLLPGSRFTPDPVGVDSSRLPEWTENFRDTLGTGR